MNRYNTKDSANSRPEGIPSISNKKVNLHMLSENSLTPKKLLMKDSNKSRSTQNLTLKAINDLSLYVMNIPSLKDIKKTIDDYYQKKPHILLYLLLISPQLKYNFLMSKF